VFYAIDPSTGVEIHADSAQTGHIYRCPTCGARVTLRSGPIRSDHFAHLQWAAKPDCENYTPSRFEYRRRPPGERRTVRAGVATSYLSFSLSIDGPRLGYWLPPAPDASWPGAIEFEAHETSRIFRASDLWNGQRVEFTLIDGQWEVRNTGIVADEYMELLAMGWQSLDASGSIFDAETVVGRQILPGQSVAYGQSLYWVSRVALEQQSPGVRLCDVEEVCCVNGWYVYFVELPLGVYTGDDFAELVQWLERRVRPVRPKVWIESPWPRSTTSSGFCVYEPADGELVVCADQVADIRIGDSRTGNTVVAQFSQQRLVATDLPIGVYDITINDELHETFVLMASSDVDSDSILVRFAKHAPVSLAYAQSVFGEWIASRKRSVSLVLTWGHPAVRSVVRLDGRPISQYEAMQAEVVLSPGMRLDAGNLGRLEWPAETTVDTEPDHPVPPQLRQRATWLLSVAKSCMDGKGERVAVPYSLRNDALFKRLAIASWNQHLIPQVRAMSKLLSEWR
jgi:hypothetical protein